MTPFADEARPGLRYVDDGPSRLPKPRLPDPGRAFLAVVVLVAGTVTAPQIIGFGETSGLGVWTLLAAAVAWVLWVARPYFPRDLSAVLLPLALFVTYAVASFAWTATADPAVQNLSILVAFLGLMLLSARESERDAAVARAIHRAMDAAGLLAGTAYLGVWLALGRGGDAFLGQRPLFLARPFALFAMFAVARAVARWMAGARSGLWVAVWLVALVYASDSRTALFVCLALFPLAFLSRGDRRGAAGAVGMAAVAAAFVAAALTLSQDFYDRFFKYDASIQVGGVAINGSGRAAMWELILEQSRAHPLFGHGVASASGLIELHFPGLGHPHNDFLRYLYDFGAVGLALFTLFLLAAFVKLAVAVRRGFRARDPELAIHLTALLSLAAMVCAMMTDNPVTYVYVMSPLAVLLGCSLGRLRAARLAAAVLAAPRRAAPLLEDNRHRPRALPPTHEVPSDIADGRDEVAQPEPVPVPAGPSQPAHRPAGGR